MVARTDRTTDEALRQRLLLARRGQSYFSRKLNELSDEELAAPSLLPGWTRAHLVAHVGLNARALTRLIEWAATGVETPMYATPEQRDLDIEFTATLPAQALRNLSDHAAIHLGVEWRDLPDEAWSHEVRTAQGRTVPAAETVWMRTREVWIHAVDLANGASFDDFPPELLDALIEDVLGNWERRGVADFTLEASDRSQPWGSGDVVLRGSAAELARWATGRGAGEGFPAALRWL